MCEPCRYFHMRILRDISSIFFLFLTGYRMVSDYHLSWTPSTQETHGQHLRSPPTLEGLGFDKVTQITNIITPAVLFNTVYVNYRIIKLRMWLIMFRKKTNENYTNNIEQVSATLVLQSYVAYNMSCLFNPYKPDVVVRRSVFNDDEIKVILLEIR